MNPRLLDTFFNLIPEPVLLIDRKGTIIAGNSGATADNYFREKPCSAKSIHDLLPAGVCQLLLERCKEAHTKGTPQVFHYSAYFADCLRQFEGRLSVMDAGTAIILIRDITRSGNAHDALLKMAHELNIEEGSGLFTTLAHFLADALHAHTVYIARYTDISLDRELTPLALYGRNVGDKVVLAKKIGTALRELPGRNDPIVIRHGFATILGDGVYPPTEVMEALIAYPLRTRAQSNAGTIAVLFERPLGDTQLQEAILQICASRIAAELEHLDREKDLLKAVSEAEELNKLKTSLLANLNHEFRTPMNGILGFANVLRNKVGDPDLQDCAQHLYESAQRLMNTLSDIITLARVEANQSEAVRLRTVSLNHEISEIVFSHREVAERFRLDLRFECPKQIVAVHADSALLRHCINNLIANALKFTQEGGVTVSITTENQFDNNYGLIQVIDTGIGMSQAFIPRAFESFTQESQGTDRDYEGTGLGLSIVKKFTEAMHGKVLLESAKGFGTTVSMYLPLSTHYAPEPEELYSIPTVEAEHQADETETGDLFARPLRILIAEDDRANRRLAGMYLRNFADVAFAGNEEEVFEQCRCQAFDMILFDVNLGQGVKAGMDTVARLRQLTAYAEIPIIAVTAYTLLSPAKFRRAGFSDFLGKPYNEQTLRAMVRKHSRDTIRNG